VADCVGLIGAFGEYRSDLAARFLGLEAYPRRRAGGRLEGYRGDPPLPARTFPVLAGLAHRAIRNLDVAVRQQAATGGLDDLARFTCASLGLSLEELAAAEMPEVLASRLA